LKFLAVLIPAILILIGHALLPEPAVEHPPAVTLELVDTALAWASPCWGYNAPKIVRNRAGEMWAVNFFGKYGGHEQARIVKRTKEGRWVRGAVFDSLYQPSMIFLDREGRLNYIQNSQTLPMRHYRSADEENLQNFSLVATGNGVPDGRGWYVGVAVRGDRMFLAYVTLAYDLFYTWKDVKDATWRPAVLVEQGLVDTARGNHSWLYPKFTFTETHGFIAVSSTVDGSKHNTYDKVCMASFPLESPEKFTKEVVYEGAVGYYSYCYDVLTTADGTVLCGFNAGRHKYGPVRDDVLPAGVYIAVRAPGETAWQIRRIDEGDGGLALFHRTGEGLYALVTRGSWDKENHSLLKKSTDLGESWTTLADNVFAEYPARRHQFFTQGLREESGSALDDSSVHVLLTDHESITPSDGLYRFDLLHLSIRLR
jgi:hypothetical protein